MKRRWLGIALVVSVFAVVAIALVGARPSAPPTASAAPHQSMTPVAAAIPSAGRVPTAGASPFPSPEATPGPSPGSEESLAALLAMLRIAPENRAGYSRSLFVHWIDADGNGCDTRHEVLIQEAVIEPTVGSRCSLSDGTWFSLYDGRTFTDPSKLQIDHVVPLAEAWDSGAWAWTANRRMRYANDLDPGFALIAVSATTNESKADDDPADWLPPAPAAECPYLGDWIATKVRWDLAVDQREHDALSTDIGDCPATTMPYLPAGPAGEMGGTAPTLGPSGPDASGGSCDAAYPTVCIPPPPPDLDCGQIPYRNFTVLPADPHHFDGDHDGIGCET